LLKDESSGVLRLVDQAEAHHTKGQTVGHLELAASLGERCLAKALGRRAWLYRFCLGATPTARSATTTPKMQCLMQVPHVFLLPGRCSSPLSGTVGIGPQRTSKKRLASSSSARGLPRPRALEVFGGSGPIQLGGHKQRAVLAHLLVHANAGRFERQPDRGRSGASKPLSCLAHRFTRMSRTSAEAWAQIGSRAGRPATC